MVKPFEKGRWLYHPQKAGPGRFFLPSFQVGGFGFPGFLRQKHQGFCCDFCAFASLWWAMVVFWSDRGQEKKQLSVTQPNPSSNIHQQNIAYVHLKSTKGLPIKGREYYDNQDGQTTREPNFHQLSIQRPICKCRPTTVAASLAEV